jgi:hypothetical protein
MVKMVDAFLGSGVSPDAVGEMVLRGVRENALYIHTDRIMEAPIQARTKARSRCRRSPGRASARPGAATALDSASPDQRRRDGDRARDDAHQHPVGEQPRGQALGVVGVARLDRADHADAAHVGDS